MTDTPASVPQVPLEPPSPALIDEIFSKEADKLTDADIEMIIAELRSDRAAFLQASEEAAAKPKGKRATGIATNAKKAAAQLSIDDLFNL